MGDFSELVIRAFSQIICLTMLIDFYFLWPKRMARLERSQDQADKKKLERYRRAIDVYKLRWPMRLTAVLFAISIVDTALDIAKRLI